MKKKSLFRNGIISVVTLLMMSAVIYSCQKNTPVESASLEGGTFFSVLKAVTPSDKETGAYQVELAFRDKNGNGAIPSAFELNMPGEKNYHVTISSKTKGFGDVDVYTGTVKDGLAKGPASEMLNFTLVDDPRNKTVFADFEIDNIHYLLSKKEGNTFRLSALKPPLMVENDAVATSGPGKSAVAELAVAEGEQCNGVYIIDLFVGFSDAAVASTGAANINAYANDMVATVNNGLANSLVNNVRLRLVGVGTNSINQGVVTGVLQDGQTWYASELARTGADLLSLVQEPTNAPGSAAGWGYMPGWVTVSGANWTTVYRHEAGHNAGSNHCTPGIRPYAAGYDNGHWRTHMCGNSVNYYSNPDVRDDRGNPIGDANTANNARLWRERAAEMSGRVAHTIPFANCGSGGIESGATYSIISALNNSSVLDVAGAGTADGTKVHLWANFGNNNQKWKVTSVGGGYYKLQPQHAPSKSLDVNGGGSANGTQVQIWAENTSSAQKWRISSVGNGYYTLVPECAPSSQLDINGGATTDGTKVQIWNTNTSNAQRFRFVKQLLNH